MTNNDRYMLEALKNDNTVAPPSQHRRLTENRRYWESYITYKTLIWDLEMGGGIRGRQYWEGQY